MSVTKAINVATELFTAEASGAASISHARIVDTTEAVVKTKWKAVTGGLVALDAGQRMEILDEGFTVTSPAGSELADAYAEDQLDAMFVDGDKIEWSENGSTATANLAATAIVWHAAAIDA